MAGVFVLNLLFKEFHLISRMELNAQEVFSGQPWRLITFLFIPTNIHADDSLLHVLIVLSFCIFWALHWKNDGASDVFSSTIFLVRLPLSSPVC